MGAVAALISGGGSVTTAPAHTYSTSKAGSALDSTVTWNANGTVLGSTTGTVTVTDTTHSWYVTTTPLIGAIFFLRVTPTIGTLTTNGASAFTSLASALAISRHANAGTSQSCTYTVDIATDAGGVNIVSTTTGNVITADGT